MPKRDTNIPEELIAAFLDGNTTAEETREVLAAIQHDSELRELLELSMEVDEELEQQFSKPMVVDMKPYPMLQMAARNQVDNLCVVRCEGYALRAMGVEVSDDQLMEEAREKGWLREGGVPLYLIGRMAGERGLYVSHAYDCSFADIHMALKNGEMVIAVLGSHAVIVKDIAMDEKRLALLDFANPQPETTCPFAQFTHSWSDASSYLVIINNLRRYQPRPLSLDNVPVEDELMELREAIAENAHEVWAAARVEEGWTYGEERNDQLMHNPDIVPYNILPESEKEYDRMMAINTIKLIKKLGWKLVKNDKPSTQE